MSELAKRILVALPAAALFLYLTWLGGWFLMGLIIVLGLIAVYESIELYNKCGLSPDRFFPYSMGLWILLLPDLPYRFHIGLALFLLFVIFQIAKTPETSTRSFASTLFCGIYAPLGLLSFILIRRMASGEEGFMLALILLLMVWGNDVFAYFGGKSLGKNLLAPTVSPKKTWEGFGFGFLGALAGVCIALFLVPLAAPISLLQSLPAVALVGVVGPIGDLSVSKLKRAAGVKDTSHILPGHGGIFDRLDALILAAPAYYLYLYGLKVLGYAAF
ncbi:MAG: phosphatidate cytidylyltransferase [Balneolaceae bacterium]|nr:phosphatidate cytidylyltransferase [Balneolaceae bacterium]